MALDQLGGCLGAVIEPLSVVRERTLLQLIWLWFGVVGAFLVLLVTFCQVSILYKHEHIAGFIGLAVHIAVLWALLSSAA